MIKGSIPMDVSIIFSLAFPVDRILYDPAYKKDQDSVLIFFEPVSTIKLRELHIYVQYNFINIVYSTLIVSVFFFVQIVF